MKLFYIPFSLIAGILGARAGKKTFATLWDRISDEPKPTATTPGAGMTEVAVAAALEGATMAASTAIAHLLTVRLFHHLFGAWPVKEQQPAA